MTPDTPHRPTLGLAVLGVVAVTIAFAAWLAAPLAGLGLAGAVGSDADEREATTDRFASNLDTYAARFNGRYLFFDPPPPRPEPRPIVREEPDNRPPPPPATYGGPRIVAIFADEVWFADRRRLRVGGEEEGSLRVISLDSPWSVEVEWRGVNFTVPFIARASVIRPVAPPTSDATKPGAPDAAANVEAAAPSDQPQETPAAPHAAPTAEAPAQDPGATAPVENAAAPSPRQTLNAEPLATTETQRQ